VPSVMEAPDGVYEKQQQDELEAERAVQPVSPTPRRQWWRLLIPFIPSRKPDTRRPSQWGRSPLMDPSQPELQPIDRLARDFPHLYTLAAWG
jgi:hypothetical protein